MNRRKIVILGFLLGLAAVAAGCAAVANHSMVPDYKARTPRSIAVLPVMNETVSLKAPEIFRPMVYNKLSGKGYETPVISSVDSRLLEKEIREAGQIHTLPPQELGKLLGVDALLYTTVTEFSTTYLVAYASMTVSARFELKDAKSGEKLWDSDHAVKERKLGLSMETLKFAALQSYQPYVEQVISASLATLPDGPLPVAAPRGICLFPATK